MKKLLFILLVFLIPVIYSCKDDNDDSEDPNNQNTTNYPSNQLWGTYTLNENNGYDDFIYYPGLYSHYTFRSFDDKSFLIWGYIGPSVRSYAEMYKRGDYYYELSTHGVPLRPNKRMKGKYRYNYISPDSSYDFIGIYSSDTNFNDTIGTFYFKQISRDTLNLK
ncbi:MAG: hypothetical protein M0P32_04720 [Bacteroidales bacterium]|nr:hypothetical protein [Bacteroidales bacterium]MDD3286327.1 hypothetical protein [Bacteroidales bacterium]MDY4788987.1 hypothetical protein [Bacteroidales bacterium]